MIPSLLRPVLLRSLRLRSVLVFLLLVSGLLGIASAQNAPKTMREQLESIRLELAQTDAALQRDTLNDRRLGDLRAALEPLRAQVDEVIQREQPRVDEIKARIDRLGPAPDAAKGQTESAEVARDRAEQQRLWQEADETLRLSRALALRIEQTRDAIAERRRANFAREILAQGPSIVSPLLWLDVTRGLPGDLNALNLVFTQWAEVVAANLDWYEIVVLALLAIAAAIGVPRARRWMRRGGLAAGMDRAGSGAEPSVAPTSFAKAMYALRRIVLLAVAPAALMFVIEWLLTNFGLVPARLLVVMNAFTGGLALVLAMGGLANAMLAPGRAGWRLFSLPDRMADAFNRLIGTGVLLIAIGKFVEALQGAIVAPLPATIAVKGVMAVLVALAVARGLHTAFAAEEPAEHPENEHAAPVHIPAGLAPLRLAGWATVVTIIGAALLGFVALASFLVDQLLWLTILGLLMLLALVVIDEMLGEGLSARGAFGRRVREVTGIKASSLDQMSVLGSGLARLMLYIVAGMLLLAPWGVDSSSLFANLRAAFFGFQVGGVTISLATIGVALVLFALGFGITRAIQNWLDTHYLPKTGLDIGLRNSIRTIFGYIGTVLAATFALTQLGLSFEKLAIVAGALSVGIGFGLKSIVENFVSGLILLWERPIRVGDQIVIGDEQGTVKRINVRATEIETFDKASLIIPNSEFISGRVKNWMHADRTGRIIIPVSVEYDADPEAVDALLKEAALAHREVLSEPKPFVLFTNLGESGLDFQLYCYVDVDSRATTRSELLFDIFRRLKAAGIHIPYPTRRLEIANISDIDPRALLALDQSKPRGS